MEIVCTVGPATLKRSILRMMECAGATVFRLNLSYTENVDEVSDFLEMVKAVTLPRPCIDTHGRKYAHPFSTELTMFDEKILKYSSSRAVGLVAVSFTQTARAIRRARELSHNSAHIIAKIEDQIGLENRKEIIEVADVVLIDRGDLSKSIPVEDVPYRCAEIICDSKSLNTPVWVATNLLESMVTQPQPTLAEVNDIASLILQGVDGLVLAAETAIGKYPVQCVEFVRKMSERYKV